MSKLTYAGFNLLRPVPDLMTRVQRWWDDHAPELWSHPGYLVRGSDHLPVPAPPAPRKLQINTLVWPQGASRWGVMYALADAATVAKIRAALDVVFAVDGCEEGAPTSWSLSPSGFTGPCAPLNLPLTLPYLGGLLWGAPILPDGYCTFGISGTTGTLTFSGTAIGTVTYTVTVSGCRSPLTLNKASDGLCTGLPATIVLTPAAGRGRVGTTSAELYMDGPDGAITPQMFLIDSRPVFVQGASTDLRLLVLVDDRYFWWGRTARPYSTTWTTLLRDLCRFASGITPTVPAIPAGYGTTPSARWAPYDRTGVPLPLLIDAAAAQLGFRFLFQTDLTCEYVAARYAATADLSRYNANKKVISLGGYSAVDDLIGNIPESVAVAFWGDVATVQEKRLPALSLPAYGARNGVPSTTAWLTADPSADAGVGTRDAWATQAATDFYNWALARSDYTLAAVRPVRLTGFEDRIEWEFSPGVANLTRIETGRDAAVVEEGVNPLVDEELSWKRTLTRIVPANLHDRNLYGTRPPPGYSYVVKLVEQQADSAAICDLPWAAKIQTTDSFGCTTDGPWLGWYPTQRYVLNQVPGATAAPGDYVTATPDPLVPYRWIFTPGGGGDATRLVLLIAKTYTVGEFIAYSAVGVTASTGPPPITYTVNGQQYGPSLSPPSPVYHLRNLDVPVCPPTVPGGWTPAFVDELSVVRIWPGPSGTWLFSTDAWQDLFRRTGESDADGDRAFLRYYDQNTGTWVDGREVRVILVS